MRRIIERIGSPAKEAGTNRIIRFSQHSASTLGRVTDNVTIGLSFVLSYMASVFSCSDDRAFSDYRNGGSTLPILPYLLNFDLFIRQVTYRIPVTKFLRWNSVSCAKYICQGSSVQAQARISVPPFFENFIVVRWKTSALLQMK